jgi:hypothetical protein
MNVVLLPAHCTCHRLARVATRVRDHAVAGTLHVERNDEARQQGTNSPHLLQAGQRLDERPVGQTTLCTSRTLLFFANLSV